MRTETETRAVAGLAGVITGVMLIGTSGLMFVVGWTIWALALAVLLSAAPRARGRASARPTGRYAVRRRRVVSVSRIQRGWPVVKSIRMRSPSDWTS